MSIQDDLLSKTLEGVLSAILKMMKIADSEERFLILQATFRTLKYSASRHNVEDGWDR